MAARSRVRFAALRRASIVTKYIAFTTAALIGLMAVGLVVQARLVSDCLDEAQARKVARLGALVAATSEKLTAQAESSMTVVHTLRTMLGDTLANGKPDAEATHRTSDDPERVRTRAA